MFSRNVSQIVKSNVCIQKRFISGRSQSSTISEASTSKTSPNSDFGNMRDELKSMKKDMKNQNRDFPNVRENSQLEDDTRGFAKDSGFNNRMKKTPQVGASEGSAMDPSKERFSGSENSSFNGKAGDRLTAVENPAPAQQFSNNKSSTLNANNAKESENLESYLNQGSYRSEEQAKKARQEDNFVHKAENVVLDTIDSLANRSKYADGKKSEEVGEGIFSTFSNGIKKAQTYYKETTSPEYYAERHSKHARDYDAAEAEAKQQQNSSAAGDHERSDYLNNPRKVSTADEMNWGQENTNTTASKSSIKDEDFEKQSLAQQTTSGLADAASNLKDAAKGAFEKVKETVNDLTSSKKQ